MEGKYEGRVSGITTGGLREIRVVGGDDQAEQKERNDVEQGDPPEHLLCGLRNSLAWVCGFSSGKTDQLSTTEGEGSSDEDGTETLETIAERTWLVPVMCSDITSGVGWDPTTVDDNTQDDEPNNGTNFDEAERELNFTVSSNTENVDYSDQHQENSDPGSDVDRRSSRVVWISPECNRNTRGGKFERQDDEPVKSVVPAHSKSPSGVDEADRVVIEGTGDRV